MRRRDKPARRLAGEGAVHLVDALPAVQMQGLGDGGDLILLLPDALEGRNRAVTGRDLAWEAGVGSDAGGLQRRCREVEIEVVDGNAVGPLLAVLGEQRR